MIGARRLAQLVGCGDIGVHVGLLVFVTCAECAGQGVQDHQNWPLIEFQLNCLDHGAQDRWTSALWGAG
jgi:hypothetical protein